MKWKKVVFYFLVTSIVLFFYGCTTQESELQVEYTAEENNAAQGNITAEDNIEKDNFQEETVTPETSTSDMNTSSNFGESANVSDQKSSCDIPSAPDEEVLNPKDDEEAAKTPDEEIAALFSEAMFTIKKLYSITPEQGMQMGNDKHIFSINSFNFKVFRKPA